MKSATMHMGTDKTVYSARGKRLLERIKVVYPQCANGAILLFSGFECDRIPFRQESFFYYFTGIREPGLALTIDLAGRQTLWVPTYSGKREQWVSTQMHFDEKDLKAAGFDVRQDWGDPSNGYQLSLPLQVSFCKNIVGALQTIVKDQGSIFTVYSVDGADGIQQRLITEQLKSWIPGFGDAVVDVTAQASVLRRRKDAHEIGAIGMAIELTQIAQEAAVRALGNDVPEAEVRGQIEYVYAAACARPAFSSIVAAGVNGTVLHYVDATGTMFDGDLVVIDIGAECDGYAADITRTYPVSGSFTSRQQELYSLVLDTQLYIADKAQPGMWLSNKDEQDRSLNHLARAYLDKYGYGSYFPHGIGHFLGLDVHDVGDVREPLQEGDVITIEPGIYIPQEGIGIRIEDDYWITPRGAICLSDELPKQPEELCSWMAHVRQEQA